MFEKRMLRPAGRGAAALLAVLLLTAALAGCASSADCLKQPLAVAHAQFDLELSDGRTTQITLWQPTNAGTYPLMVFSHGAFSAPERYVEMLSRLSAMGFVVAAPLHIDSELIATDPPPAPAAVWRTRKQDVAAALGAPAVLRKALMAGTSLAPSRVVAGHSYGAFGAQVMAGAAAAGELSAIIEPGIEAVVAFSPPGLLPGFIEEGAWAKLARPQLLITGTGDVLPGFLDDWREHAAAWEEAPAGDQWLWVGEGVDHYFGKVFGRLQREVPAQRAEFDAAMETTRRFLATYVSSDLAICADELSPGTTPLAYIERR